MKLPKINIIPWHFKAIAVVATLVALYLFINRSVERIKTNITHTHPHYKDLVASDSLLKVQLGVMAHEAAVCDSSLFVSTEEVKAVKSREAQHQTNNLELSRQLNIYRRDHRVCYRTNCWGKTKEVPCSEINVKDVDPG